MGATSETQQSCLEETSGGLFAHRYRLVAAWIWLALLGFPLAELLSAHVSGLHLALVLAGLAGFVVAFLVLMLGALGRSSYLASLVGDWERPRMVLRSALVVVMFCIAFAMTLGDRGGWASMFIYTAAVASMWTRYSTRVAALAVLVCVVSATSLVAARGASTGTVVSIAATCAGIGFLMLSFGQLRLRNLELLRARDEIARLAVAEERLRFARDLHDLLGHSLSVIALKAELAGRMLERDVDEAATHVAELEQVARTALAEVREAASGYRRPALASELDGARMALEAAGIATNLDRCDAKLAPEVEALLAWTVREGTTNVIRHSRARSCRVAIEPGLLASSIEVLDDGPGMRFRNGTSTDRDGGSTDRDGGSTDRDGGSTDRDGGSTDRDGGSTDRDGGSTDRDGGSTDRDGGSTDRDGDDLRAPHGGVGVAARAAAARGHGLDGLRERAERLGGELQAGPARGGGFRLRVTVPAELANAVEVSTVAAGVAASPGARA